MAINPELITTIRVDQLPDEALSLTNLIPHSVGTDLKSATIQELVDLVATAIGVSGGVGYIAISVTDGQQLPDVPELPSFFLCGAGTFLNINGYPDIICTENLNAVMSLTDHWELAVEIPINPLSGTVQSVTGSAVDNTDPLNPVINSTGGATPTLQEVTEAGNETTLSIKVINGSENSFTLQSNGFNFEDIDDGGNTLLKFEQTSEIDQEVLIRGLSGTVALLSDITDATPTLQEVLDEGDSAEDSAIFLSNTANDFETSFNEFGDGKIAVKSIVNDTLTEIGAGVVYLGNVAGSDNVIINKDGISVDSVNYAFPSGSSSPLATLADIPSSSTFVPYTGATTNVDLGTHKLLAEDLDINHTSGSGDAATITKGGSGEALKVVKTSGSGNAASITGGVTLLDELHLTTDLADAYISSASTWNAKQNALSYTPYRNLQTSQTAFTGSTAETILFTATIPSNTFNANDIIHFFYNVYKTTQLGSYVLRLKINTTNTLTGAATVGTYNGAATTQIALMNRNLHLFGGNLYGYPAVSLTLISDIVGSVGTIASNTLNPANQFFIFGTVTLANASDNIIGTMFKISN
jgi:hypothetical protein